MNNSKVIVIGTILKEGDCYCLKIDIHRENDNELIVYLFGYGMLYIKNKDTCIYMSSLNYSDYADYEFKYIIKALKGIFPNLTYKLHKYDETVDLYGTTVNI